ncbi:hypothetical protein J4E96_19455 [Pengzhenrongella sicca]|uniref:Uncharacterized protein n=1 Tax=Pengzhenrongella sicca TaxID=2819238 RepID=A0A8A4ZBP0_9MICO|nr:hypothetical protein [Pengzhenrongella sicca]QTE29410.1 hypothetical protein J4E96_19455 [Pengzhenrongella sicca]
MTVLPRESSTCVASDQPRHGRPSAKRPGSLALTRRLSTTRYPFGFWAAVLGAKTVPPLRAAAAIVERSNTAVARPKMKSTVPSM